ncbi:MAG: metal ABC transporter permease [Acidobacteriota bacterium]
MNAGTLDPTLVILLVASCVAASCALVGSFLVLRGMALLGDAISHAVLPGIAVAFLWSGSREPVTMLLGAAALGVMTVFLVELGTRTRRLQEDASIGVVFPALFSIGVILIARYAGQVDLDLDCVLYGEIAYTPWDLLEWNGQPIGPRALVLNGGVLALVASFLGLLYKELKLSTFDPALAAALGFSPVVLHYALMTMVSITVVGAFESVGAILVVAMLVVPPATAYLLTERLGHMLILSVVFGVASAWLGYALARWLDASIAGSMAVAAGGLFTLVFAMAPTHGLVAKALNRRRLRLGMAEQLLMLHLEQEGVARDPASIGRRFGWATERVAQVATRARRRGWVTRDAAGGLLLTAEGLGAIERSGQASLRHPPSPAAGGLPTG